MADWGGGMSASCKYNTIQCNTVSSKKWQWHRSQKCKPRVQLFTDAGNG